jgi:hypothetical protein
LFRGYPVTRRRPDSRGIMIRATIIKALRFIGGKE